MFAKATKNFLREVDSGGDLIAVSNLNDSDKLQLLSLVTKKKRFWCWQRPKYNFLSVTLGDVLIEDQFLSPVVVESDFVKYEGKFKNHVSGTIETTLGKVKLNIGGKGLMESQSSFGTLRKQEVDLQQLLRDAVERTINLKNPVLQQVLERKNEVLCVLIQKIATTQKCVISEHIQVEEKCGGIVGIQTKTVQVQASRGGGAGLSGPEVSAAEDRAVTKDTNVVLEIPASTTIAYSVIELYVKANGQFEFCLLQGKHGGFEQERRSNSVSPSSLPFQEFAFRDMPDAWQGPPASDKPLSVLKEVTLPLEKSFHPFAELPEQQQTALSGILQAVLFDDELLLALEQVVRAEMLKLQIIPTLCHLLHVLSADGESDLEDAALAPLRDTERFEIVQRLLAAADINLERQQSSVKAVTCQVPNVSPLVLYISLNGLWALGRMHQ
ncbi:gasdermin-E [Pteropus vampyrus]|uniref:Gasdermin-E n=1 Tax=Pteropus vampyrus TaxID=132908 RepID=A0A6P6CIW0_PTEVA|nr:gasdermin-E [Pteropus vampyrus]